MSDAPLLAWSDCSAARMRAREIRDHARRVRAETARLRRYAQWHYRLHISGGAPVYKRAVVDELGTGPLCTCLATRLNLTRFSIEHVVGELRRAFVIDTIAPCGGCGSRKAITLHGRNQPRQPSPQWDARRQ